MPSVIFSNMSTIFHVLYSGIKNDIQKVCANYTELQRINTIHEELEAQKKQIHSKLKADDDTVKLLQQQFASLEAEPCLKKIYDIRYKFMSHDMLLSRDDINMQKHEVVMDTHLDVREMLHLNPKRREILRHDFCIIVTQCIADMTQKDISQTQLLAADCSDPQYQLMFALLEHVLDDRSEHFNAALPARMHHYCKFNEITQLLMLLRDISDVSNDEQKDVRVSDVCDMYLNNVSGMRSDYNIPVRSMRLELLQELSEIQVHKHTLQAVQKFLVFMARKEMKYILAFEFSRKYNAYVDNMVTIARICEVAYKHNELSCQMRYARIARILQVHCTYHALNYKCKHDELRSDHTVYSFMIKVLRQRHNVALELTSKLVLGMRAYVTMHMINHGYSANAHGMRQFVQYMQDNTQHAETMAHKALACFLFSQSALCIECIPNLSKVEKHAFYKILEIHTVHHDGDTTLFSLLKDHLVDLIQNIDRDVVFVRHASDIERDITSLYNKTTESVELECLSNTLEFDSNAGRIYITDITQNAKGIMHMLSKYDAPCSDSMLYAMTPRKPGLIHDLGILNEACSITNMRNEYAMPGFIEDTIHRIKLEADKQFKLKCRDFVLRFALRSATALASVFVMRGISQFAHHNYEENTVNTTDTL